MSEKHYRFIVSSAEEAITVLKKRLGENARVVSVRQVEGKGLAKFLQAPKLEVIAEVLDPAASQGRASSVGKTAIPDPETAEDRYIPSSAVYETAPRQKLPAPDILKLLQAGGIPASCIARLRSHPEWSGIESLPTGRALGRVGMLLKEQFDQIPRKPLGSSLAFIGGAGSGKTSVLCKQLTGDVFIRNQSGTVLKLDLGTANPGDGLAVFCDALGVPCVRTLEDVPLMDEKSRLYIDVPGFFLGDPLQVDQLRKELAQLPVQSLILVVNAVYDSMVIKKLCEGGERAGCTHVVFTHLDELTNWGKLWEVLLAGRLTPLFLSTGQNIAADYEENIFEAVLARTFPELGKEAAREVLIA